MKSFRTTLTVGLLAVAAGMPIAGQGGRGSSDPVLPYKLVEWPAPPASAAGTPGVWNFIQVSSVAVTSRGTVLVLHRGAHPIMEFESTGKLVRTWGDGMFSE